MDFGREVAGHVLKQGNTVADEMKAFRKAGLHPKKGWIHSPDRKTFEFVPNGEKALELVEHFAHITLNDADPTAPQLDSRLAVGPSFEDVVASAVIQSGPNRGAIDLSRIEALEGRFGSNGGRGCDVRSGPCSCGAFH